ncbi:hypothetical protein [Celeribacter marinus]|uniref:Uncharacterized protein n=1 Tax=Celeribacter marinus TaxID=1397108 RepID=A0A0P0A177_9RHOB|nr:hypothetical protein [Celeribacter marinus]ALI56478.1 hypothetical protein IMCC12053_2531 [Celeribacter marinus]SFK42152.1 hypothetical protein SAMN05444421_10478 [Celeribacter marinus]
MVKSAYALAALAIIATPVFAADYQPAQHGVTQFAYEQHVGNYCPAGLQPIRYNGIVCCGEPNATGYSEAPVVRRHAPVRTYAQSTDPKSPAYTPERIPMGKSPNSMDGS